MRLRLLAAIVLSTSAAIARADTTFYFTGSLISGATFTGTLLWSPNGGVLNLATFTELNVTTSDGFSYQGGISTVPNSGEKADSIAYGASVYNPAAVLVTDSQTQEDDALSDVFTGTFLCGTQVPCGDEITPRGDSSLNGVQIAEGTIALAPSQISSVTPEPSSIALLGTGLLGALGVARKRFQRI